MPILSPLTLPPTPPGRPEQLAPTSLRWRDLLLGHGSNYTIRGIEGWEDLPPARMNRTSRPWAHGTFPSPVWSEERIVTVTGTCGSTNDRDALLTDLQARLTYGASEDLTVTQAGRTLTARAQLVRFAPEVLLEQWPVGSFPWAAQWRCPDPFRYGPEVTASTSLPVSSGGLSFPVAFPLDFGAAGGSGRVTLENAGTADSWPVFEVTGPLASGFELTRVETGSRLRYVGALSAGQSVFLDGASGSVLLEGTADRRALLTAWDWFAVPAGGVATVQFSSLGGSDPAASLVARFRPAFW